MEWTEIILPHVVELIGHIAWPMALVTVLLLFRRELRDLLNRLTEYEGRAGVFRFGETNKPPASALAERVGVPTEGLSDEARKILATLWERQTSHFKDDRSRRWSFRITPASEIFGIFTIGFAELLKAGLVSWTRKDGQALLTDEGIEYVKQHPEIRDSQDIYRF